MAPRKTAAQRTAAATPPEAPLETLVAQADAEGLQLEDATSNPEPENVDALRYDPNRTGAPEPYVAKNWPHAARPQIVGQLFDAADALGYPHDVVRSTSDGFRYPENLDRYLFPSEYRS